MFILNNNRSLTSLLVCGMKIPLMIRFSRFFVYLRIIQIIISPVIRLLLNGERQGNYTYG